jgi:hypothetical protein
MEQTPYNSFEIIGKVFRRKVCNETTEFIPHTKMMPECKNVTKQNCVTKWETDADGKQVRSQSYNYWSQSYDFFPPPPALLSNCSFLFTALLTGMS